MNDERIDILIGRTADGAESREEWRELCVLADREPIAWRELACQQRDGRLLTTGLRRVVESADEIPLPELNAHDSRAASHHRVTGADGATRDAMTRRVHHPERRHWLGWVVAASIAAAWGLSLLPLPSERAGVTGNTAGLTPLVSADEALRTYLDRGRADGVVVGEMPSKMLLQSRPLEEGEGFEVVFVRQIVERRSVPALIEFTQVDEFGRPVPNIVHASRGTSL